MAVDTVSTLRHTPVIKTVASRAWADLRRHPAIVTCAVLFVAYFAFVWASAALMQLNSDKVWVQTVFALRGKYGSAYIESSSDTYLLKAPLYIAANHLFGLTLRAVQVEVAVENLVLFASLTAAYALLRRTGVVEPARWPLVALAGLWTISVCDPTGPLHSPVAQPTVTLIHPNERNAELGLAILILVVVALLDAERIGARMATLPRVAAITGLALAAGAVCFDDPYNLYLVLPPLVGMALVRAAQAGRWRDLVAERAPLLWYFVAVTVLSYAVMRKLAINQGMQLYPEATHFLPRDSLGPAVTGAFSSLLAMYDGSFFDGRIASIVTIRLLLNAVLAVAVVVCGLMLLARWYRPENRVRVLLPLGALAIAASFILGGRSATTTNVRYLIVFVPVFLLVLPGAVTALARSEPGRVLARLVCGLLALSAVLNAAHVVDSTHKALTGPDVNRALYVRAATIAQLGLTKGYATYWNADVNTYVSRGNELTIPVQCRGGKLRIEYWLMDTAWLKKPTSRTYLIRQPGDPMLHGCPWDRLLAEFGPPAQSVPLGSGQHLLVYDYDILSRMPTRTNPAYRS